MTSAALGWLLYELSLHLKDQTKIMEEILQIGKPAREFTVGNYNSLTWLNVVIKVHLKGQPGQTVD